MQIVDDARRLLEAAGLEVTSLRSTASFAQLEVRRDGEAIVLDLVADPTPIIEHGRPESVGRATILVETEHQLLVNKLCALLSRSELRDLVDVRALLDAGGDPQRALADCPRQDAGFSPLTFSWSVRSLPVEKLASSLGWGQAELVALVAFRDALVDGVLRAAHP